MKVLNPQWLPKLQALLGQIQKTEGEDFVSLKLRPEVRDEIVSMMESAVKELEQYMSTQTTRPAMTYYGNHKPSLFDRTMDLIFGR